MWSDARSSGREVSDPWVRFDARHISKDRESGPGSFRPRDSLFSCGSELFYFVTFSECTSADLPQTQKSGRYTEQSLMSWVSTQLNRPLHEPRDILAECRRLVAAGPGPERAKPGPLARSESYHGGKYLWKVVEKTLIPSRDRNPNQPMQN